ncbi:hypothetical protein FACS1894217_04690 [Clostridia bacterium]|nr:hypothetical protein FACS1894217_04690 [Clostridia bacterium]GHV18227.1 hypothetical protein FACS189425_06400 [Clostridia bacterium]
MNNEEIKGIINALGAMSEMLGAYRDMLLIQGFTRVEAVQLCQAYMAIALSNKPSQHEGAK